MVEENHKNINMRGSLALNFKILQIGGVWPPENDTDGLKQQLYRVYSTIILVTLFGLYFVSEIINMVLSYGDLEKLTNASFLLMTHLVQFFKYIYFHRYRQKLLHLANDLNSDTFRPRNTKQYQIVKKLTGEFQKYYKICLVMAFLTVFLWGVFPFVDTNTEGTKKLPMSAWYPFETTTTRNYAMIFAYQMVSVLVNAYVNISLDTVGSGFMSHICIQLDLLNDSIKNIFEYSREVLSEDSNSGGVPNNVHGELRRSLKRCVTHHQKILQFKNEVNEVFAQIIFWQFAISVIIICITMFKLTLVSWLSIQFVSMLLYQGCMLVEILYFCWYGNEMILKSTDLTLSAWNSDWTGCSQSYKRDLLFLMMRTQKPMKIYGGFFFELSLETFIAILRSSWSYFAVLYKVHSRPQ